MSTTSTKALADREVELHAIEDLLLDKDNPRFGGLGSSAEQSDVVEFITKQFGVDDVLASLATNGFFQSEPLVAKKTSDGLVVVEGNRRLAACLILANDKRASKLQDLRPESSTDDWSPKSRIPVLVFDGNEQDALLPYLGVRHIVGSQPWDSFAKARWIHQVVSNGQMSLQQIESAIGDTHRTITRMLDGYRFVTQLREAGHFKTEESQRRGKGSNTDFPFSWVYTLLDYSQVRDYLDLTARSEAAERPIPDRNLKQAARTLHYMFGSKDVVPAIRNSRQIGDLADALSAPSKRELLEAGYTVDVIISKSRPPADRFATQLREAEQALKGALGVLSEGGLSQREAEGFAAQVNALRNSAGALHKGVQSVAYPSDDDAD